MSEHDPALVEHVRDAIDAEDRRLRGGAGPRALAHAALDAKASWDRERAEPRMAALTDEMVFQALKCWYRGDALDPEIPLKFEAMRAALLAALAVAPKALEASPTGPSAEGERR